MPSKVWDEIIHPFLYVNRAMLADFRNKFKMTLLFVCNLGVVEKDLLVILPVCIYA